MIVMKNAIQFISENTPEIFSDIVSLLGLIIIMSSFLALAIGIIYGLFRLAVHLVDSPPKYLKNEIKKVFSNEDIKTYKKISHEEYPKLNADELAVITNDVKIRWKTIGVVELKGGEIYLVRTYATKKHDAVYSLVDDVLDIEKVEVPVTETKIKVTTGDKDRQVETFY